MSVGDVLNEMILRQHLTTDGATYPVRYFDSVGSTNDVAREWIRGGVQVGALVVADEQTSGRGRQQRGWVTPTGQAIAMSIILDVQQPLTLFMIGSVAVAEACASYGAPDVSIKWPNDVLIAGGKVAGILPEVIWQGGDMQGAVLGIGVNVRVDFPDELRSKATNLERLGLRIQRARLIAMIHRGVMKLAGQSTERIREQWITRLATIGQRVRVGEIVGVAKSVTETGALLIEQADGSIAEVVAGEAHLETDPHHNTPSDETT